MGKLGFDRAQEVVAPADAGHRDPAGLVETLSSSSSLSLDVSASTVNYNSFTVGDDPG